MAKTAKEKTPIQKAAEAARNKYQLAKAAVEKADNATTQKALSDATTARDNAVDAERRERFLTIGGARVAKSIDVIANVGKLAAPRSYAYTEDDIAKLEAGITNAAKNAVSALRSALQKGAPKAVKAGFTFE